MIDFHVFVIFVIRVATSILIMEETTVERRIPTTIKLQIAIVG